MLVRFKNTPNHEASTDHIVTRCFHATKDDFRSLHVRICVSAQLSNVAFAPRVRPRTQKLAPRRVWRTFLNVSCILINTAALPLDFIMKLRRCRVAALPR